MSFRSRTALYLLLLTRFQGVQTFEALNSDNFYHACRSWCGEGPFTREVAIERYGSLSNWQTHEVTNMDQAFYVCPLLTNEDLNGWDTSSVTSMNSMSRQDHLC